MIVYKDRLHLLWRGKGDRYNRISIRKQLLVLNILHRYGSLYIDTNLRLIFVRTHCIYIFNLVEDIVHIQLN